MVRRAFLFSLLLAAACARSEDASLVTDTNEARAVERVRTPEQDDEELAIGEWRDTLQDQDAALEFGPTGAAPLFSLRCDTRRSVFLQRHGAAAGSDLPMMLVTVGSETRRLAVTTAGGPIPMLRASLARSDTLIDTLARAATPTIIRIGDSPPLVMPPSPSVGTFLSRCESGPGQSERGEDGGNTSAEANETAPPAPTPVGR
jgi:hypothetical protein